MRHLPDISLARFLMIVSMILLGVLEYLWLHNEYENKYQDMEEKLNHVMFSTIRDVEDSLIFSRLSPDQMLRVEEDDSIVTVNILGADTTKVSKQIAGHIEKEVVISKKRHPIRGILLERISGDSSLFDSSGASIGTLVMRHIRLADSTGELAGYKLISWQHGDTVIEGIMSRPQFDIIGEKKIALSNEDYKAELFHDLLPHISFAIFLWLMVGGAFYYSWKNLKQQMQLNALRDEFVSNITHELKTPITTVGVALESLSMDKEWQSSQSKRYLEICQSELKRLSMLVERILHNRAPQIHYERLDIRKVLEEVVDHMKVQLDNKQAVIDIDREGESFIIKGDKTHMSSVLYNLLENALKYTEQRPVIHIHLTQSNGSVRLDIADNGIGIDPVYHQKIFDKLYRVPQHNRHDAKGHGLGLSYVADVVKKHKGQIDLKSELGKGATFSIKFPAWHEN